MKRTIAVAVEREGRVDREGASTRARPEPGRGVREAHGERVPGPARQNPDRTRGTQVAAAAAARYPPARKPARADDCL